MQSRTDRSMTLVPRSSAPPVLPSGRGAGTLSEVLWWFLTLLALFIGLVSLRYALPHIPHPAPLPNFTVHHGGLVVHAISASLALLLGPWQFLAGLRRRRLQLHRVMGWAYAVSLVVAAGSAIWIAPDAAAGHVSSAGFLALAFGWLFTTSMGILAVRRGNIAEHRRWMLRSYALTAAAITLRIYLALIPLFHWRFASAYPVIAWMCWVPNLFVAQLWLRWTASRNPGSEIGLAAPRQAAVHS